MRGLFCKMVESLGFSHESIHVDF
ncbi:hypothetical protein F383_08444 [Gossypium arboreum]|uniref:Uncharacterized protein n=1 Tax=Gossypium arboreum TaxID=29729 RepID=A0A0B0PEE9_GOSAR|nr:hypothetical protein F383_08444 [Gossypium arboreum]